MPRREKASRRSPARRGKRAAFQLEIRTICVIPERWRSPGQTSRRRKGSTSSARFPRRTFRTCPILRTEWASGCCRKRKTPPPVKKRKPAFCIAQGAGFLRAVRILQTERLRRAERFRAFPCLAGIFPVAAKAETCYNFSGLCVSQPIGRHSI